MSNNTVRETIALAAILAFLGALGIGYLIWYHPCCDTTLIETIDPGFGLSFDNGPINKTYNCSVFGVDGMQVSWNMFNAIDNYFVANGSTVMLGENNITNTTGVKWITAGYFDLGYSEDANMFGNPSNITRCEGRTYPFTMGCMVIMFPIAWVATYYNGTTHYGDFTFKEIDTFATALSAGNLTKSVWDAAKPFMWRGEDHLVIYDWQKMSTGAYPNLLYTSFNGVNATLVSAVFMP